MNIICKIVGHQNHLIGDNLAHPICSIICTRCKKILKVYKNPLFNFNNLTLTKIIYIGKKCQDLTYGKIYKIIHFRDSKYCLKNDKNSFFYYNYKDFISITEYRKKKLKKLQNVK